MISERVNDCLTKVTDKNIRKFKVIIVGNSSVGKSSLMLKFIENRLATVTTTMADVKSRMLELMGQRVELEIWDTAGMERFHAGNVGNSYYRKAQGIMIVYDITDEESFKDVHKWLQIIDEKITEDPELIIIGNKMELSENRVVSTEKGIELSMQHGAVFLETSAANGINVNRAFHKLATALLRKYPLTIEQLVQQMNINAPININSHNQTKATNTQVKASGCC